MSRGAASDAVAAAASNATAASAVVFVVATTGIDLRFLGREGSSERQ
jgi:hypothetical protein